MTSDRRVPPAVSATEGNAKSSVTPSQAKADPTAWPSTVSYPETPAEHIRNVLQILGLARAAAILPSVSVMLEAEAFAAITRRLTAALFELETAAGAFLLPPRFELTPAGRAELEQLELHAVDCGFRGCPICSELKSLGHELSPVGHVLPQGVRPAFLERPR
jgi:hypothetical protein